MRKRGRWEWPHYDDDAEPLLFGQVAVEEVVIVYDGLGRAILGHQVAGILQPEDVGAPGLATERHRCESRSGGGR